MRKGLEQDSTAERRAVRARLERDIKICSEHWDGLAPRGNSGAPTDC